MVAGCSTGATLVARDQAVSRLDARAAALQDVAEGSLRRTGRVGPAAALARAEGGSVRAIRSDRPLPGGRDVETRGDRRAYVSTTPARGGNVRLTVALPHASVAEATRRTLTVTLAAGLALLLLTILIIWSALRRAAVKPLRELGAAVDRLAEGKAAHASARGAREVVAVAERLGAVGGRLADLEAQATTDSLTGVGNRRGFQASLTTELKRAGRQGEALTLVLIDLDGFKEINDTHGHPFGDGVLQMVAEKVRANLRATDVLARVGGDEFAVLLPATTRDRAEAFVQRARDEAAGAIGGVELTWSAGVAAFPADAADGDTLVECADAALYCAKATGRSTVCHYDPEQSGSPSSGGDLAAVELALALPDGIVPVYQPVVSLRTGQLAGYEALARFPHPPARRPDEWFAIATRCGLGPQLERRAVEAALAPGRRPPGTFLAFNLSASALMSDEVVASLPLDLSDIVIELTGNERGGDPDELAARLEPLRARGARIAVDDAGAGYSGLQQVMRFQPDLIKLDRSLVADVDSDPAKAALIDSFVRLAARTGAAVCAEGVETREELQVLAELDVTYGQGFGIARPAPPWAAVAPWVAAMVARRPSSPDGDGADPPALVALP
jgi:diguanylate cyclase (GGDEF)-like protein